MIWWGSSVQTSMGSVYHSYFAWALYEEAEENMHFLQSMIFLISYRHIPKDKI